jgi:hypothetical protein
MNGDPTESPERSELQGRQAARRLGLAWILLCVALALHVADEAATDFLSVYNPTAQVIRQRLPFLPLPVFTFQVWLTGLCVGILLLAGLSPLAFRRARLAIGLAHPLAVLMFVNGLVHIGGSLVLGRRMPGVYSSPFLLCTSAYLLICARKVHADIRRQAE